MQRFAFSFVIAAIFAVSVSAQEPAAPEVIKFSSKKPAAGDMVTRATTVGFNMAIDIESPMQEGVQTMNQALDGVTKRTVTVLEAKDGNVTKFTADYKEAKSVMTQSMPMLPEPMEQDMMEGRSPTGHVWTFTVGDDGLKIVNEEGEEATGELYQYLSNSEWSEGKLVAWSPNLSEMTDKREIAVGETIVVDKERALAMMPKANRQELGADPEVETKLTLKGTTTMLGAKVAIFETTMKVTANIDQGGMGMTMTMTMDFKGEIQVGVDNMWTYKSKMSGPMDMNGGGEEVSIAGKGTIKADDIAVYSKKKKAE